MARYWGGVADERGEEYWERGSRGTTSIRKVGIAAFFGAMIEWYDYFLYGLAAAVVFNQLFFPSQAPLAGTLAAFATFGVGFFFRPVGGMIFGHLGDRLGRKTILVLTLLIMGVATFAIGLLPTHGQIGVLAPILLVILRTVQGIGVGGEWGGAALMVVEHAPAGRRGFYGSCWSWGCGSRRMPAGTFSACSCSLTPRSNSGWLRTSLTSGS